MLGNGKTKPLSTRKDVSFSVIHVELRPEDRNTSKFRVEVAWKQESETLEVSWKRESETLEVVCKTGKRNP